MNSLFDSINSQTVLIIAAIAMALLLANLMIRVVKANLGLIISMMVIGLVLQYAFGISVAQLWSQIGNLPQDLLQLAQNINQGV